ncbi:MAG: B12-binding domain-containing radical SAM protein [Candidatus Margulisbacteria bacterium]|nr:B12-binding domain-containing radical SAM protein [Candidatus Margulisiibacteriota bacterium]
MANQLDVVLINPGDRKKIYQSLGDDHSSIEPPYWVAVLAAYLRQNGISVALIDANAENISPKETAARVADLDPLLAAVIVYGSQPSASTQNMTIAGRICQELKQGTKAKVALGGLHPSALPKRTLKEESVDYVIDGEGPYTLKALIDARRANKSDLRSVPGLWYREEGAIKSNPRASLIKDLDAVLPVAAWDLLPMSAYKAHNWHCFQDLDHRQPYAAIYTSLGCPYSCEFCCINAPFGKPGIRYRSPQLVVSEIEELVTKYGVKHIKIIDELFVLKEQHYMTIVDLLLQKGLDINIWAYARVDTVKSENLAKMKKAGINWLALGIESANPDVRDGASKRMRVNDIKKIVNLIQDAGIYVIGNYIFGLPDDNLATMQQTLDMALELNCEFANMYCAMAYPGSKLYERALKEGWQLPKEWHDFSQHSYDALPLPTKHLSAKQVLKFRDDAFHRYFENAAYLSMIEIKFGQRVRQHVQNMTKIRLKRKILED